MQVGAFFRKEALDVVRQPLLLLTLVFGPFLIMAIFGIGYRDTPERLRTLFVAADDSPFIDRVEGFAEKIGDYVDYAGVTSDADEADRRLRSDDVDVVITFPDNPLDTVRAGDRAPITVIHTRLDPVEQTAISFATRLGVDEINSQILAGIVEGGQDVAQPASAVVSATDDSIEGLERAVEIGDFEGTVAAIDELDRQIGAISLSVDAATALTARLGLSDESAALAEEVTGPLEEIRSIVDTIGASPSSATAEQAGELRTLLSTVSEQYAAFTDVDPAVLVRPFESRIELAVDGDRRITDWYAPAAVILMLQQFGVAFGALSFVRERQLGIVDVYRVAPVDAAEALIGKYLAYLLIGAAIAAALLALVVSVLDVPVAGSLGDLALVVGLTLFASIGLGFVISLASASDAQAVQYTMILLLASLFFSGFFLAVGQLEGLARYVSWLLPVSYGMQMLRDVMLRGVPPVTTVALSLAAYGSTAFVFALLGARRRMGSRGPAS
jgi:ABC-2 type transport system permease protein